MFATARKSASDSEGEVETKKDDKLIKYLENPNPNTVLIFTMNGKLAGNKKITRIINEKNNLIEIPELKVSDIYLKIEKLFKEDGYKCSKDVIYYIINNSLNNYDLSFNEVEKIKLYYGKGCEVSLEDVSHIISRAIEDNNFKFVDSVLARNIKEAFKRYDDLMVQKIEPVMLMSMLTKEIRNMLLVKKMLNNKTNNEMKNILGYKFDFQLEKTITNSYDFSISELESYLLLSAELDYKAKNGMLNARRALELFILDICK
jgi:DNA polymerase-3 subunit delta